MSLHLSSTERAILRHVAHHAGEDRDARDGWCRWSTSDQWPWAWDDYKPLVERDLLKRRETWKDVLLKLSDDGWDALGGQSTYHGRPGDLGVWMQDPTWRAQ